jgi:hypothetical protein
MMADEAYTTKNEPESPKMFLFGLIKRKREATVSRWTGSSEAFPEIHNSD